MSKEKDEQLKGIGLALLAFAFAALYAWGGMEDKWLRRFLAPAFLTAGVVIGSRNLKGIWTYPLLAAALSLGYGAEEFWQKVMLRTMFGAATGAASAWLLWITKRWLIAGFHVALTVASSVVLGVWNPLQSARAEEFTIGLFIAFIPILSWNKDADTKKD